MNTDRFRGLRRIGDDGPLAAPFTCQFDVGVTRDSSDTVRPCVEQFMRGIGTPIVTSEVGHLAGVAKLTATAPVRGHASVYMWFTGEGRSGKSGDVGVHVGIRASSRTAFPGSRWRGAPAGPCLPYPRQDQLPGAAHAARRWLRSAPRVLTQSAQLLCVFIRSSALKNVRAWASNAPSVG
jgi:hypothetical protein